MTEDIGQWIDMADTSDIGSHIGCVVGVEQAKVGEDLARRVKLFRQSHESEADKLLTEIAMRRDEDAANKLQNGPNS